MPSAQSSNLSPNRVSPRQAAARAGELTGLIRGALIVPRSAPTVRSDPHVLRVPRGTGVNLYGLSADGAGRAPPRSHWSAAGMRGAPAATGSSISNNKSASVGRQRTSSEWRFGISEWISECKLRCQPVLLARNKRRIRVQHIRIEGAMSSKRRGEEL